MIFTICIASTIKGNESIINILRNQFPAAFVIFTITGLYSSVLEFES